MSMLDPTIAPEMATTPMGYEQFLAWIDEDFHAEWVDGEVQFVSPASNRHQDLARFLTAVLSIFTETNQPGGVRPAPFQMRLAESSREPDILFLTKDHLNRLKKTYLDGPTDLVIEIISPESVGRDRGDKLYEYEANGVVEYWLVDPQRRWAEFYLLDTDAGRYRLAFEGKTGRYQSEVIADFWFRVEWLWEEPLPAIDEIMLDIGGAEYAERWIELLRGSYL